VILIADPKVSRADFFELALRVMADMSLEIGHAICASNTCFSCRGQISNGNYKLKLVLFA